VAPALRLAATAAGGSFPRPEHVPLADPIPIARWLAETLRRGGIPHLYGFVSPIVRLCRAALEAGIDIRGARLTITGEPVTAARLAIIRATGAEAAADYGSVDAGGPVSHSCLDPSEPDDLHFFQDLHALIQAGSESSGHGLPPRALLLTSLRLSSPLVLLNVSMGDQAYVTRRRCACPLGALGWDTHLCAVRSFEKLTAGGMTFLDADIVRILEEELPSRCGGGPDDYQIIEEEGTDGAAVVVLAVHPRVGPVEERTVRDVFLGALGRGSGAERLMALNWREAGLPRVERREPVASAKGKVLHVWRSRSGKPEALRAPGDSS
jgi:hypothetical protein